MSHEITLTLAEIARRLDCPAPADGDRAVTGIAGLSDALPTELSFIGSERFVGEFESSRAIAVIARRGLKLPLNHSKTVLLVNDAELATATVLEAFAPPIPRPVLGWHSTAIIAPTASIGAGARIGSNVFIGDDCRIGANCILHPGAHIGARSSLGDDCEFFPGVVVRERITIGSRVVIHAGSVVGSDGFGYRWNGKQHVKIPQIGVVIVEDDVEIGSCVCIDRAKFGATRIGRGTKIDNLVQVAHNVQMGPHCIVVGQAGLAGSVTLGSNVVLGGQCAVRDHITMGDGSAVAGCAGVAEDVEPRTIVSGLPALPHRQTLREQAALRRLPDLVIQVRKLQEQLDAIQKSRD